MNKTERMLAIVLELQNQGHQRAEDLATTFEVSKRTIYRDIDALCETGVPIVSARGQGYSLVEGYFLPPLNFTIDEALMLVLGTDLSAQSFDTQYKAAAENALKKIEAVLPSHYRQQFAYLKTNIRLYMTYALEPDETHHWLQLLRRAIIEQRQIQLDYAKRFVRDSEPEVTVRCVNPYSLARLITDWYLLGYCHLRKDIRVFRLSRILNLSLTTESFQRPLHFAPHWTDGQVAGRSVTVRARFTTNSVRWIKEAPSFYLTSIEEHSDGPIAILKVRHEDDVFQWLFSWGTQVEVLEPLSLRRRLATEAHNLARKYKISNSN